MSSHPTLTRTTRPGNGFNPRPVNDHPLFDTADCRTGQSGHVWFLGATFTAVSPEPGVVIGPPRGHCTVPAGTALFFPIIDAECAAAEGNGTSDAGLRTCARATIDRTTKACDDIFDEEGGLDDTSQNNLSMPRRDFGC